VFDGIRLLSMKLTVFGAGAWGTALAIAFAPGRRVTLLARDAEQAKSMCEAGENSRYLPGCPLPAELVVSSRTEDIDGSDLVLIATPVSGLRDALSLLKQRAPGVPFLWACKGLEAKTGALPHQVVADICVAASCGALSGPSFAQEVAHGLPTAITLAAEDADFARDTATALHGSRLRIYANDDLVGVEIAGAVKNVLAIASGISDGLGLGLNARAALITRGLAEITRFGVAAGAKRETFMGLAGVGDLILTCTGDLSRNRHVGLALAAGHSLQQATKSLGHVAEGVNTAREVMRKSSAMNIEMPICNAVCGVLDGRSTPQEAVERLMGRDPTVE
jgi:glycerol-3-phosphate dehydrogenase (NAD(P)+)